MKRDFRKHLIELVEKLDEFDDDHKYTDKELERYLEVIMFRDTMKNAELLWCAAQKQFLKDILQDLDDGIEKVFGSKDSVRNDKARIVAEETKLKEWLKGKYHYLKRKNGKASS